MHRLWRALPADDQLRFVRVWRTLWSVWRHPVPIGLYEQLHDAVREGIVHFHRMDQPPVHRDGQFQMRTAQDRTVHGSILVDATGWGACTDSIALLRALRSRRLIEIHPCGGIHVDPVGMRCMVGSRPLPGLFAIGPIARGVLFSTNAHWFNPKCAAHWARQWVAAACEASSFGSKALEL
jgi:uncharacterized NAD(P)/FAD-binding protein YdhS